MSISVKPSGQACGAEVTGVDLRRPLDAGTIAAIGAAWAAHHVLAFPDQDLSDDDLERFTTYFGALGDDPYFNPVAGRRYVAAIERRADETSSIFAESWHCDWSFSKQPPIGTCLYGKTIPPVGGDTLFANQHAAYAALPPERQRLLDGLNVVHSAVAAYSPEGLYGQADAASGRTMTPKISEEARAREIHPLIQTHAGNGQKAIYGCWGYSIGVEGMAQDAAMQLLTELLAWQTRPEFIYVHKWQPGMLVMWDNRSLLHRATGGYDGHARLLHRTTIWLERVNYGHCHQARHSGCRSGTGSSVSYAPSSRPFQISLTNPKSSRSFRSTSLRPEGSTLKINRRSALVRSKCHRSSHSASDPKPEGHLDPAIATYRVPTEDPWRS